MREADVLSWLIIVMGITVISITILFFKNTRHLINKNGS
jgi:hypothetical protein